MKNFLLVCVVALAGCGGGGGDSESVQSATATSYVSTQNMCGVETGAKTVTGVVTGVHDGDTITLLSSSVGTVNVRLEGIDAPELAQPYGTGARDALSAAILGRSVTATYSKLDQYGRTVAAVFTGDCRYVNLDLVRNGWAWYYKAYQCELSAATRAQFAAAQAEASQANVGLWVQGVPEAPWYFRNGTEPTVPVCTEAAPGYATGTALTVSAAAAPLLSTATIPSASSSTSTKTCYVGPKGGTYTITASGKKNYGGC